MPRSSNNMKNQSNFNHQGIKQMPLGYLWLPFVTRGSPTGTQKLTQIEKQHHMHKHKNEKLEKMLFVMGQR